LEPLEEIASDLAGPARAIVIASNDIDLRPGAGDNRLFILKIGEGSLAAGGRGGGFGERKVTAVLCFERKAGVWSKMFQASENELASYEVPYHVSRLPLTMSDGTESMGYGVVDAELVAEMGKKAGLPSSP
jgi:hypothetical protein